MEITGDNKLIRLDAFDTATAVDPTAEDDAKRRFMTLILQTDHQRNGNVGNVLRTTNTNGEIFAVKLLTDNAILSRNPPNRSAEQAALHLANTAALFEEYRYLCTVSHLRGFPRVYGYGSCEGDPLILMEWVEGISLKQALHLLPHDASGGLTTKVIAAIGSAALRALLGTQGLVTPIVHRDLSPANIMFRTSSRSLERQIAECAFDPCLVDMGSATVVPDADTLTKRADIWRFATPAYAAPEMLTQDIDGIAALRRSPSIDVYALSSILYELYSGRKPFDIDSTSATATGSFYLIKTQTKPASLKARCDSDAALIEIIMKGLSVKQEERPSEQQMLEVLEGYIPTGGFKTTDEADGDAPIDIDAGTHLTIDIAGERAREILEQEHRDAITRRRFVIGGIAAAVAGLAIVGAATDGFGIPAHLNGIRRNLDAYSWRELQEISLEIKGAGSRHKGREIAKRYNLLDGDGHIPYSCTKRVKLSNGLEVGAQLVGIRHDELTDGTGVAGLSFIFDAGIAERGAATQPLDTGWKDCELRTWLDGDGLDLMPDELRAFIKPVKKISNNTGSAQDASCLTELTAMLWLPAMVELCGIQPPDSFSEGYRYLADIYNGEGKEYQLFSELKISPYSVNDKMVRRWKDKNTCWWERTVSPDMSEGKGTLCMNRVGSDGDVFMYATPASDPQQRTCVIPGFCI